MKIKVLFLFVFVVLILFLRLWALGYNDLLGDDALYSFRALGWFDFLGGGQTTPVQWFNYIPWWANLSFHDAPPLVFLLLKLFFFFGDSAFIARLPFALAGLGTIIVVFFIVKDYTLNWRWGLFSAFVTAISSYLTWAGRVGYLEGVELFFIATSFFLLVRYVNSGKNIYFISWAAVSGIALITKYTALFIIPASIIFLIIKKKKISFSAAAISAVVFIALLSPVIIYNAYTFAERGHFDATLSSMIGVQHEDFIKIQERKSNLDLINIYYYFKVLWVNSSVPYFLLFFAGGLYSFYIAIKRKESIFILLVLYLLFGTTIFLFIKSESRFLSIIMPFLTLSISLFIIEIYKKISHNKKMAGAVCAVLSMILISEILYNINTNIVTYPIVSKYYSPSRFYSLGFNELDVFIKQKTNKDIFVNRPSTLSEVQKFFDKKAVWIFDERINWFAYSWYIQKYIYYYGVPFFSADYRLGSIQNKERMIQLLQTAGYNKIYFIYAANSNVFDSKKNQNTELTSVMNEMEDLFITNGSQEAIIKNKMGQDAFIIYSLQLL